MVLREDENVYGPDENALIKTTTGHDQKFTQVVGRAKKSNFAHTVIDPPNHSGMCCDCDSARHLVGQLNMLYYGAGGRYVWVTIHMLSLITVTLGC